LIAIIHSDIENPSQTGSGALCGYANEEFVHTTSEDENHLGACGLGRVVSPVKDQAVVIEHAP
jgi:hypothetical protein